MFRIDMLKTTLRFVSVALVAALFFQSCKSEYEALLNGNDVDAKYTAANAISAAAKALDFEAAAELRDQLILVKGQLGQKLVPKKKKK